MYCGSTTQLTAVPFGKHMANVRAELNVTFKTPTKVLRAQASATNTSYMHTESYSLPSFWLFPSGSASSVEQLNILLSFTNHLLAEVCNAFQQSHAILWLLIGS